MLVRKNWLRKYPIIPRMHVIWDSVMRVIEYNDNNKGEVAKEVKKFFTELAYMPLVTVEILSIFEEGY